MNYWRMAFRKGSQGYEMWPDCLKRGIAAIGYYFNDETVVEDCSKLTEDQYDEIWRAKRPRAVSPRNSLKNLAYRMKKGDIIYVKQGPFIVGKGKITSRYKYDPDILAGTEMEWEHYVKVDWQRNFPRFRAVLGVDQTTVLKLEGDRLKKLEKLEPEAFRESEAFEAEEGERVNAETTFIIRNRALIEAKKANSDFRCEVCEMNFKEEYGDIGERFIIAHHLNPLGNREEASKTTLDDIALVCANCHAMLHRGNPPLSIIDLRQRMRK